MAQDNRVISESLKQIQFGADGLIPVVAQDTATKAVLMLAWMNEEALTRTLAEGRMVYWSRSRGELWRKGDTSGNTQKLVKLTLDCDGDTLLAEVEQSGPACHTGSPTCFFTALPGKAG